MHRWSPRNVIVAVGSAIGAAALALLEFGWELLGNRWVLAGLGAALAIAAAWAVWDATRTNAHTRESLEFARVNGWSFSPETRRFSNRLRRFPFGQGVRRRDLNLLTGSYNGRECATFLHEFEQRSLDRDETYTQVFTISAVALEVPLAVIDIVPEDMIAGVAKFLGGQDIRFESHDFNRHWRVMCANPKYAHDIVHPRLMERLIQPDAHGLALRIEGNLLISWIAGRRSLGDLARRLNVLTAVAAQIPEFVYREFREAQEERESRAPEWATTPYALTSGRYTGIDVDAVPPGPPLTDGPSLDKWHGLDGRG